MESTLAVADAAYNSGRRSRSTSFHSQQQHEGREDLAAESHDARSVLSPNVMNTFNSSIFHSHRRHASDVSDISALLPNNDSEHAIDSGNPSQLDLTSHSRSPSFTQGISPSLTTFQGNLDDGGLDEAFNASLFMSEDYPRQMNKNQYYTQNPLYPPAGQPYQDSFQGGTGYSQGGTNNMGHLSEHDFSNSNRYASTEQASTRRATQDVETFDDLSLYDDHALLQASLNHLHRAYSPYGGQPLMAHASAQTDSSSPNLEYGHQTAASQMHSPLPDSSLQPRDSLQSPRHSLLEVPGADGLRQGSLDVHTPYSESVTYDGSAFDEQRSPSVDPLTLSRTNSYNSQFQPSLETHLVSAPTSPYPSRLGYGTDQLHSPIASYDATFNGFPIPTLQYGFLQPHPNVRMETREEYIQRASLMIPGTMVQNVFDPPDISINPPSPHHGSFANRPDLMSFPFNQQVPIITTTPVTSHLAESQHVESPDCLQVDKSRGRSNSDSRLMVQQHPARSRSHSSHGSSSSGRVRSRSGTPGLQHKQGSHRIAKPLDHHRRASWSGARNQVEQEYEDDASRTPNKQKNPATFICPVEGCHKAFTRAYNLRSHQRTHTNERPFLCESCGKGFARQHDRKRHEKLHTNEKPFSCPGCKKKFARMDALSRHFKSETGKDCIIGNPEYEHFLLEGGDGDEEPEGE